MELSLCETITAIPGNEIEEEGAEKLGEALKVNTSLTYLNLDCDYHGKENTLLCHLETDSKSNWSRGC